MDISSLANAVFREVAILCFLPQQACPAAQAPARLRVSGLDPLLARDFAAPWDKLVKAVPFDADVPAGFAAILHARGHQPLPPAPMARYELAIRVACHRFGGRAGICHVPHLAALGDARLDFSAKDCNQRLPAGGKSTKATLAACVRQPPTVLNAIPPTNPPCRAGFPST